MKSGNAERAVMTTDCITFPANSVATVNYTHTHSRLTAFGPGLQDNPGRPVPEETLTHSHQS